MLRLSINKFNIFFLYQSNNEAHANLFSTFTPFQTIPIKTSPFKFYILLGVLRLIMNFPFLCMWCDDALCFNGFRANFYIYSSFSKKIRWFRFVQKSAQNSKDVYFTIQWNMERKRLRKKRCTQLQKIGSFSITPKMAINMHNEHETSLIKRFIIG